jgi:hypothetical protein
MLSTTKIRTLIAVLAAMLSFAAVAPAVSQAAVKSRPSGDVEQDAYCQQVANLINKAYTEGDLATVNGRDEDADAWYDLAHDLIRRGTANGCNFYMARRVGQLSPILPVGEKAPDQGAQAPIGPVGQKAPVQGVHAGS